MRTSILILCGLALLLPIVAGQSRTAEPELWLPGPGGNPVDIDREVLWLDNPDVAGATGSSEVIGAFELECEIANDFMLEMDATIRKVTQWGAYYNDYDGTPTGTGFNLRFYMMDADCLPEDAPFLEYLLPGNDCCEAYLDSGDMFSQYVYEYCLELPLATGVYWFSAQMADHEFPLQWGRLEADRIQMCLSVFRSVYFSYPDWEPDTWFLYEASQMFEDVCEATPIENSSWGSVKVLYR